MNKYLLVMVLSLNLIGMDSSHNSDATIEIDDIIQKDKDGFVIPLRSFKKRPITTHNATQSKQIKTHKITIFLDKYYSDIITIEKLEKKQYYTYVDKENNISIHSLYGFLIEKIKLFKEQKIKAPENEAETLIKRLLSTEVDDMTFIDIKLKNSIEPGIVEKIVDNKKIYYKIIFTEKCLDNFNEDSKKRLDMITFGKKNYPFSQFICQVDKTVSGDKAIVAIENFINSLF